MPEPKSRREKTIHFSQLASALLCVILPHTHLTVATPDCQGSTEDPPRASRGLGLVQRREEERLEQLDVVVLRAIGQPAKSEHIGKVLVMERVGGVPVVLKVEVPAVGKMLKSTVRKDSKNITS